MIAPSKIIAAPKTSSAERAGNASPVSETGGSKILLVDDDPAIRRILLRLLTEEGYNVIPAADGLKALDLAAVTRFDVVLLDLNMPGKSGWDTFEHLTAKDPLLPIIVITAKPNQLFPALASGVGALLEKPLDFVRLLQTIHELIKEPAEMRLARLAGQPSPFSYIPPREEKTGKQEETQDEFV